MNHSGSSALTIAIVGAGFAGTAMAANLHRFASQPLNVLLFEKRDQFGLGDAYSTPHDYHLLNVRAEDMSAFEQEPHHFVSWLSHQSQFACDISQPLADQYVPRLWYGRYLQSLLKQLSENTTPSWQFSMIAGEVIDARPHQGRIQLQMQDGQTVMADQVVLALGNPAPAKLQMAAQSINVIQDPWDYAALKSIGPQDPVLIVGTGLSMIDTVLTLQHQHHQGKIVALSRRGLLPLPHAKDKLDNIILPDPLPARMRALTRLVRVMGQTCQTEGKDWRALIHALRSRIPAWWSQASVKDKQQFIRHVLPYWNIHRHRVHQDVIQLLQKLQQEERMTLMAGRLETITDAGVQIRLRHHASSTNLPVKWVINCMGPALSLASHASPLIHSLLHQGLAAKDPLGLGFAVDPTGVMHTANGERSAWFHTIGSPARGAQWETSAVPEIRKQCHALATHLLSSLRNRNGTNDSFVR